MKLKLTKPLAFFDIEGTGLDISNDRICSIAILKIMPDGSKISKSAFINPTKIIPEDVIAIHGITNELVKDCPTFAQLSKSMFEFFKDCDLAGFNSNNYDVPLLAEEFLRCGIEFPLKETKFVDVGNIFKKKEERTLSAAVQFYCQKELIDAHTADADVEATVDVFISQLEKYPDLQDKDVSFLQEFSEFGKRADLAGKIGIDADGDYIYNIGKTKGQKCKYDISMLEWMLTKDFTLQTKRVIRRILSEITEETPEDEDDD